MEQPISPIKKSDIELALERLSVSELFDMAASCRIVYDPSAIRTIQAYELIDVLLFEADQALLREILQSKRLLN
jgi:hypothetical protein